MRRIIALFLGICLMLGAQCGWAKDKGLHLGGLEKDSKKAEIELKKSQQAAEKEAKKKEKEMLKKKKAAEKEAAKKTREAERKKKETEKEIQKQKRSLKGVLKD